MDNSRGQPAIRSIEKKMNCKNLQSNLMLYADGYLDVLEASSIERHLAQCPLCRVEHFETREIQNGLRRMTRPEIPLELTKTLKRVVANEIRLGHANRYYISNDLRDWLQMSLMPYGVGVFASLSVAFLFLSLLFSGINAPNRFTASGSGPDSATMLAKNEDRSNISASNYANQRLDVASESPSVNPKGALVALTNSLVRGDMKDDEVVVVADVFGNGLARISEVVEPSRDRNAVLELERALESDPAYAPFVPAVMDQRSNSVRIVLKFQSVNVSTNSNQKRRKS